MDILMRCSDTLMLFYSVMLVTQHIRFYTTDSSRQEIFKPFQAISITSFLYSLGGGKNKSSYPSNTIELEPIRFLIPAVRDGTAQFIYKHLSEQGVKSRSWPPEPFLPQILGLQFSTPLEYRGPAIPRKHQPLPCSNQPECQGAFLGLVSRCTS